MSVSKELAVADPLGHVYERGVGYRKVGAPTLRPNQIVNSSFNAPGDLRDGSAHWMRPPGGGRPVRGVWTAKHKAWSVLGGNRLAFTLEYLEAHGWTYLAPVKAGEPPPLEV